MASPRLSDDIENRLKSLLNSGKFHDAKIICGPRTFLVHRAIICTRSAFLSKAFEGRFLESTTRELHLDDEDPEVVERFLEFLYLDNYTLPCDPGDTESNSLDRIVLMHAKMYAAGDKYQVPALMELALKAFKANMWFSEMPDESVKLLVKQVYETASPTADELRKILARCMAREMDKMMAMEGFETILKTTDQLAIDLLQERRIPNLRQYCNSKHCKSSQELCYTLACGQCGLTTNLVGPKFR